MWLAVGSYCPNCRFWRWQSSSIIAKLWMKLCKFCFFFCEFSSIFSNLFTIFCNFLKFCANFNFFIFEFSEAGRRSRVWWSRNTGGAHWPITSYLTSSYEIPWQDQTSTYLHNGLFIYRGYTLVLSLFRDTSRIIWSFFSQINSHSKREKKTKAQKKSANSEFSFGLLFLKINLCICLILNEI